MAGQSFAGSPVGPLARDNNQGAPLQSSPTSEPNPDEIVVLPSGPNVTPEKLRELYICVSKIAAAEKAGAD